MKNILLISATEFEINLLRVKLAEENISQIKVDFFVTGPGQVLTTYNIGKALSQKQYDLVLNIGICGAYRRTFPLGQVVEIVEERFGDWGATDAEGQFLPIETLGFWNPSTPPFQQGKLINSHRLTGAPYPIVKGLTLNTASGHQPSIDQLLAVFPDSDVESMEGAAVALVCAYEQVPYHQIRAISNYVEPRNRDNWQISLAIKNVCDAAFEILKNNY